MKKNDQDAAAALVVHHREVVDLFAISMDSRYRQDAPNWLTVAAALKRTQLQVRLTAVPIQDTVL